MPSSHLNLCRPLLLLLSVFPSIRVFSNESALRMRWLKYWSFLISPSSEYSGLISFRDSQESSPTPQFKSINSSVLSFRYSPTLTSIHVGKAITLTIPTLVCQVICLLFNMLSRFVIAFLPKRKMSFNFMAAVTICSDFGAPQNKICHSFHFSPSICHEVMGPDAMIFVF